jgi:2-oxoglutarate ferredoxin oxidoreductase subunit delta
MATLAKTRKPVEVNIKNEWCKGCGICVGFCPKDVLAVNEDGKAYARNPERCAGCNKCEIYCPDFAIYLWRQDDVAKETRDQVNAG